MPLVVLGLYGVVGVVHEVAALRFWGIIRKATKALLMPVLLIYYALTAEPVLVVAVIAIAASWLGDLCLIRKDEPTFFRGGMVAFLLSHVFYIVTLILLTTGLNVPVLIIALVVAGVAEVFLPRLINPPQAMRGAIIVYGIVILAMSVTALQYLVAAPSLASALVFIGSLVFIFSDTLMTYLAFGQKPKFFDAITMAPYIVAQVLIVYGLTG
ncbi:MAG: lysoplasmalogenase [Propionibacteriaceae bacterium]|jgi:uncharacterized membrane protein YhhN|nr:lysoplasmalogenase [Propionibacteriaceae bacterium]